MFEEELKKKYPELNSRQIRLLVELRKWASNLLEEEANDLYEMVKRGSYIEEVLYR